MIFQWRFFTTTHHANDGLSSQFDVMLLRHEISGQYHYWQGSSGVPLPRLWGIRFKSDVNDLPGHCTGRRFRTVTPETGNMSQNTQYTTCLLCKSRRAMHRWALCMPRPGESLIWTTTTRGKDVTGEWMDDDRGSQMHPAASPRF